MNCIGCHAEPIDCGFVAVTHDPDLRGAIGYRELSRLPSERWPRGFNHPLFPITQTASTR